MIALFITILAAASPPMSLEPFMDEEAAARALDAHMYCLGSAAFEHRLDRREVGDVAADVVRTCGTQGAALQAALSDVYRRKANLVPEGIQPEEAAEAYVREMNERIAQAIQQERERRQHAQNR